MNPVFLIIAVVFFFSKPVQTQEVESVIVNCKKEIHQINNPTLERTIVRYPKAFEDDHAKFPSYHDVSESMSYIYRRRKDT